MNKIKVEVTYASKTKLRIIPLEVAVESSIETAIRCSGILTEFPEIDLTKQKVGVFSQLRHLTDRVQEGDRIEIYRPLVIDPKEARRKRAGYSKRS